MPGSVPKRYANSLGGKQYCYMSEGTVPKRCYCAAFAADDRYADPLGGEQYWYKSEGTVPKRGDCAALAAGEDSAADSPYV